MALDQREMSQFATAMTSHDRWRMNLALWEERGIFMAYGKLGFGRTAIRITLTYS
jgi:hypothetical protein